jgi:hypothetical protein
MGISRVAYFLGKNLSELPKLLIFLPLAFLVLFYPLTVPRATFASMFLIILCTTYAVSGCAYAISTIVSPKNSQLAIVVFVLLSCMLGGSNPTLVQLKEMGAIAEAPPLLPPGCLSVHNSCWPGLPRADARPPMGGDVLL